MKSGYLRRQQSWAWERCAGQETATNRPVQPAQKKIDDPFRRCRDPWPSCATNPQERTSASRGTRLQRAKKKKSGHPKTCPLIPELHPATNESQVLPRPAANHPPTQPHFSVQLTGNCLALSTRKKGSGHPEEPGPEPTGAFPLGMRQSESFKSRPDCRLFVWSKNPRVPETAPQNQCMNRVDSRGVIDDESALDMKTLCKEHRNLCTAAHERDCLSTFSVCSLVRRRTSVRSQAAVLRSRPACSHPHVTIQRVYDVERHGIRAKVDSRVCGQRPSTTRLRSEFAAKRFRSSCREVCGVQ